MLRQAGPGKLAIQDMDKKYSFWVHRSAVMAFNSYKWDYNDI
jgi:hypothetical protein